MSGGSLNTSVRFSLCIGLVHIIIVLLMLLLLWFEIVPTRSERDTQFIVNAGFQRERSRLFVNATYALSYRPQTEKAQAISALQITLPLFQREQTLLATNPDQDVQRLVRQAQPDYLFLIGAMHRYIAHPDEPANLDEPAIIQSHDQRFFLYMDALTTVLQQHAQQQVERSLRVKGIFEGSCMLVVLCLLFSDRDSVRRRSVNTAAKHMGKHTEHEA
jgi:hypothetical protein